MGACGSKKAAETAEQDTTGAARAGGTASPPGRRISYSAPETTAGAVVLPFPKEKIGLNSNHGIKPSGAFSGSTAKINQDRGLVSYPFCDDPRQMLIAVYDGHGLHGELVSEFASFTYVELLEAEASALQTDTEGCMLRNMVKCDELIRKNRKVPSLDSGSTAIVARLHGNSITTACVGDSRCVKVSRVSRVGRVSRVRRVESIESVESVGLVECPCRSILTLPTYSYSTYSPHFRAPAPRAVPRRARRRGWRMTSRSIRSPTTLARRRALRRYTHCAHFALLTMALGAGAYRVEGRLRLPSLGSIRPRARVEGQQLTKK